MSEPRTSPEPADAHEPSADAPTPVPPPSVLRGTDLLLGVVPVLAGFALVGFIVWENTQPLTPRYEAQLKTFLEQKKLPEAQACLKRLLNLRPERDDLRFTLAHVYIALGRGMDGEELIRSLARPDKRGYLPAHHWQAQRLGQVALSSPQAAKDAEGHLKILVEAAPDPRPYKAALGELYFRTRRPKEAIPYLTDVAKDNASVLMALSHCKEQVGRKDEAAKLRLDAVQAARKVCEAKPRAPEPWVVWSQATALTGDYAGGLKILEQADPELKAHTLDNAKAVLCAEWALKLWPKVLADARERKTTPTATQAAEALRVLTIGLGYNPKNQALTDLLLDMIRTPGESGAQARRRAEELAEKGGPTGAAARMVMGNDALVRNDHKEALRQFAAGYASAPDLPILANNYAWSLANLGTPNPHLALTVIDTALKTHGNDARLHGTRGGILAKLGRDKDAEAELSAAVAAGYKHPEVLSILASLRDRKKSSGASATSPSPTPPG